MKLLQELETLMLCGQSASVSRLLPASPSKSTPLKVASSLFQQPMDVCVKSKVIDAVLCSVHMKYDGGQAVIKKDWQTARD